MQKEAQRKTGEMHLVHLSCYLQIQAITLL